MPMEKAEMRDSLMNPKKWIQKAQESQRRNKTKKVVIPAKAGIQVRHNYRKWIPD